MDVNKLLIPSFVVLALYFSGYLWTLIERTVIPCLKILLYPYLFLTLCSAVVLLLALHYSSAWVNCGQSMKNFVEDYFQLDLIIVQPAMVLRVFHKYDTQVLTDRDIEDVESVLSREGEARGRKRLLEHLCRYKGWFPCLLKVLRNPKVGQSHLADKMEAAFLIKASDEQRKAINELAGSCQDVHDMEFSFDSQSELRGKRSACLRSRDHNLFKARTVFNFQVLPEKWRDVPMSNLLKFTADLTVHVVSNYVSDRRPWYSPLYKLLGHCGLYSPLYKLLGHCGRYSPLYKLLGHRERYSPLYKLRGHCGLKRFGSGMVWNCTRKFGLPDENTTSCSCRECQSEGSKRPWAEFTVVTARSLIYDDDECYFSTFTLNYDSDDVRERCQLIGVRLASTDDEFDDVRKVTCVTHDGNLARKLVAQLAQREVHIKEIEYKGPWSPAAGDTDDMMSIIISHPHGLPKRISVGKITKPAEPSKPFVYETKTCPGSCGAPVLVLGTLARQPGSANHVTTTTHIKRTKTSGLGVSSAWM